MHCNILKDKFIMPSIIAIDTLKTCAVSFHQSTHPHISNCHSIVIEYIKISSQLSPISFIQVQLLPSTLTISQFVHDILEQCQANFSCIVPIISDVFKKPSIFPLVLP